MRLLFAAPVLAMFLASSAAFAQATAPGAAPLPAGTPPNAPPPPATPSATAPSTVSPAAAATADTRTSPMGSTGGRPITADFVARRAAQTSFSAKAQDESIRAAAARVDQAWASFLPRLTATARYTRLSPLTNPSLGSSSTTGSQLVSPDPPGTPDPRVVAIPIQSFVFPVVLDNYLLQAQIVVPISDYFLRINQGYTAATHARDAARIDAQTARARSATDGKVAFYTHIRARGALVVAEQALEDAKAHAVDAKNQEAAANASRADVLRAETAVAAAELQVERAKNLAQLTEKQVRIAMHVPDAEPFSLGEDLESTLPPVTGTLADYVAEGQRSRLELKSLDANAEALRAQGKSAKAGYYPQVSGSGEVTLGNPNQRRFPQTAEWFPTWSLTLQATWSPNDIPTSSAGGSEYEARIANLEAQKQTVREGIELEVVQAHQSIRESDVGIATTKRQLESATEALRVARELFRNGRATSTVVTDAETELTRARLEALNAHVEARISRAKLEHAVGRDVKYAPAE